MPFNARIDAEQGANISWLVKCSYLSVPVISNSTVLHQLEPVEEPLTERRKRNCITVVQAGENTSMHFFMSAGHNMKNYFCLR